MQTRQSQLSGWKMVRQRDILLLFLVVFSAIFFIFGTSSLLLAAETLIYEDTVSVNTSTWSGGSISWIHTIPEDILQKATRVEAVVGAEDIDYPECSIDCPECSLADCEHDRLFVNGTEIGLLSGANDSFQANPITIPLDLFIPGANSYRIDNEIVGHRWWLNVTDSTLRFYQSKDEEPIPTNNSSTTTVEPEKRTAISIEKFQDKTTLLPGQKQRYKIVIQNSGEVPLTGIVVEDQLDPQLEFITTDSGNIHNGQDTIHFWRIGSLIPGEQEEIWFQASVRQDTMADQGISNTASVSAKELSEPVSSNTVTAVSSFIPVEPDGLRVTKRLNRREGRIGRILSYRVTIENISNGTVFRLHLDDIMPQGFSLVPGSVLIDSEPGADPSGSRSLSWDLGTLGSGQRTIVSYQAIIGTNIRRGQNINRAIAEGVDGGGSTVSGEDQAIVMIGSGDIEVPAELHATVFLDSDTNGLMNISDKSLPDVRVILSNGDKLTSDDNGKAIFRELAPGHYAIAIDPRSLPEYTSLKSRESQLIRVIEGDRARVWLPVVQERGPSRLTGIVFFDTNTNGTFDPDVDRLAQATLVLNGQRKTKTKKGKFTFSAITSGDYTLDVSAGSQKITHEIELTIGTNEITIPLKAGGLSLSLEED